MKIFVSPGHLTSNSAKACALILNYSISIPAIFAKVSLSRASHVLMFQGSCIVGRGLFRDPDGAC